MIYKFVKFMLALLSNSIHLIKLITPILRDLFVLIARNLRLIFSNIIHIHCIALENPKNNSAAMKSTDSSSLYVSIIKAHVHSA